MTSPLSREAEAVLAVMQRRPLDWWYGGRGGLQDELHSLSTVIAGLYHLEDRGLVIFRWEPLPGETEEEAQRAVAAASLACDAAYDAARAAAPWWKRWLVPRPLSDGPHRRGQYRLTSQGRGVALSRERSPRPKATLGRPLMPIPLPVPMRR